MCFPVSVSATFGLADVAEGEQHLGHRAPLGRVLFTAGQVEAVDGAGLVLPLGRLHVHVVQTTCAAIRSAQVIPENRVSKRFRFVELF